MQKKLLAVAVAGALGSPAVVLAQTSTVQIYGTMYVEYAFNVDQGASAAAGNPALTDADFLQTPGSSIGFKGEEKLGGGLSAWFQCESTADPRGQSQAGWCGRNSALGLKGGFGNLFIGNWDTPFKRTMGPSGVGANQTGMYGNSWMRAGGSATSAVGATRGSFMRRQNNSINYDTPRFGGFQGMASFTTSQPSTATLDAASNNKPRVMSLGVQYSTGPIFVGAGYERHDEFNGAGRNGDDDGWHIGAAYTWGPVRVGGGYSEQEFETGTTAAPSTVEYRGFTFGVDWKIVGPHGLRANYTAARDAKGTPGAGPIAGTAGQFRPAVPAAGAPNDTGADLWSVRYVYTFSKRTEFTFGYVKLDNDGSVATGGAQYRLGGLSSGAGVPAPGENQDAWAVALRHRF